MVNGTLRNKLQWNINRNSHIFIQENALEFIVCEMASILSRPQCVQGLKPALEGIVVTTHDGACEEEIQSQGLTARDWTYYSHRPECVVTKKPTQFHSVEVSIFHLKGEYGPQRVSRVACFTRCYDTWNALTKGIVATWCPSSRDAVFVTRYLTPLISACLYAVNNSTTPNTITTNLRT